MSAYCERNDLFRFGGLPPGALPNPARLVSAVDTSTEILTLEQHGLDNDEAIVFRAQAGGSLPTGLVEGTTYYAIRLTDSTFRVAATQGGSAVNLSTSGARFLLVRNLPFDEWIELASGEFDEMAVGSSVPLTAPYPKVVVGWVAMRAAELGCLHTGQLQHADRIGGGLLKAATDRAKAWMRGVPIRGENAPATTSVALSGGKAGTDPRGWESAGGGLP